MNKADRRDSILGLEAQLFVLGRRFRQRNAMIANEIASGLTTNAYAALEALAQRGPTRQGDLAETIAVDKAAMSRLVHELADVGLVERAPDPSDRRAQLIDLSDRGRKEMTRIRTRRHERFHEALAHWSDAELKALAETLTRYNEAFSD